MENEKEGGAYLMELFYPGGQPYTPPRDLTEEEMEQVLRYLKSKEGGTAYGTK